MAKAVKYRKSGMPPGRDSGMAISVIVGFLVSVCLSLVFITLLSLMNVISDTFDIDSYLQYLLVAVNMISIFIGSVYAAQRVRSKLALTGMAVGLLYVLFSVGIGMTMSGETVSVTLLAGKLATGVAAGVLGGLVGANLS
ncbi:MAG: TIGR04086 family membrane protein [Sporomusaceae bacterium]|nr:TIGR04086 family membrane protein [Sporomusaceae bacterium]